MTIEYRRRDTESWVDLSGDPHIRQSCVVVFVNIPFSYVLPRVVNNSSVWSITSQSKTIEEKITIMWFFYTFNLKMLPNCCLFEWSWMDSSSIHPPCCQGQVAEEVEMEVLETHLSRPPGGNWGVPRSDKHVLSGDLESPCKEGEFLNINSI